MLALVASIHDLNRAKTWMVGTSPTVTEMAPPF